MPMQGKEGRLGGIFETDPDDLIHENEIIEL
jgi:hypothetical protein